MSLRSIVTVLTTAIASAASAGTMAWSPAMTLGPTSLAWDALPLSLTTARPLDVYGLVIAHRPFALASVSSVEGTPRSLPLFVLSAIAMPPSGALVDPADPVDLGTVPPGSIALAATAGTSGSPYMSAGVESAVSAILPPIGTSPQIDGVLQLPPQGMVLVPVPMPLVLAGIGLFAVGVIRRRLSR